MRAGPQRYVARVQPIGSVHMPKSTAMDIHRRLNNKLSGNAVLVFVGPAGCVYAVRTDSDTAQLAKPEAIIGTYTRRADPADIVDDIYAWRAAA